MIGIFKRLADTIREIRRLDINVRENIYPLLAHQEIERLKKSERYRNPKNLIPFGYKLYSQNDEDGIIREICNRIGVTSKYFVEIGIGNGLQNNTYALLFDGWKGLWIDAAGNTISCIKKYFKKSIVEERLKVADAFVTRENINSLISSRVPDKEIDLLSIDIDGNDFHIFDAITCVSPKILVIEYNAKFVPPTIFCMEYDAKNVWQGNDCLGASLKFLEIHLSRKGYCLVGCNLSGTNAFFVRKDLVGEKFLAPFTAEQHYEPPRHYLVNYTPGHWPSYHTLAKSSSEPQNKTESN
ncbi:MAG: hypothetical protein WCI77_04650 [Candidatus Omnitrophota bacterium]